MTDRTTMDPLDTVELDVLRAEIEAGLRLAGLAVTPGIAAEQRARCRAYAERALEVARQSAARLRHPGRNLERELEQIAALTAAIADESREDLVSTL